MFEFLQLTGNYRCGSEIVRVANNLIRHNGEHLGNMVSVAGYEGWVECCQCTDAQAEMLAVAQFIRNAQGENQSSSIAVLLRTNWLVEQFTLGLEAYGIPVAKRVQASVQGWTEAKKVVAFAANPENDRLALELVRMIDGEEEMKKVKKAAREAFASVNQMRFHADSILASDLIEILESARVDRLVISGIERLLSDLPPGSGPNDLLIAMNEVESNSVTLSEGITVTTYHQSKGREWDVVLLPACEEDTIPGKRKDNDICEERRIFYVGVTRARHSLIVTHSATRKPQFGAQEPAAQVPSRFIGEMGI